MSLGQVCPGHPKPFLLRKARSWLAECALSPVLQAVTYPVRGARAFCRRLNSCLMSSQAEPRAPQKC